MLNCFKSYIDNIIPDKPINFTNKKTNEVLSLPEIISNKIPSLSKGSSFYVNPLFLSGHLHTIYTSIKKFENIDLIKYKRRILTIDLNKFYEINGDKLKYDQWEGESTIAIDYVVNEKDDTNNNEDNIEKYNEQNTEEYNHNEFKPDSQIYNLPPRTEYLDPNKEFELLSDSSKPLIIVLHGLSGGSYESYLRSFLNIVTNEQHKFDALVLNSRGCANHTITSPQLFNGLWTNDLRYLINEHIKPNWPDKRIYLIGFSLGGAILANYLGQESNSIYSNIFGSVIMSAPWDFINSSIQLNQSLIGSYIYSPAMCRNLIRLIDLHYEDKLKGNSIIESYKNNPKKFKLNLLKDFDEIFTSKLFGFNCANEYYRHASPVQRLLKIRIPTLIVNSKDDPIVGSRTLPIDEIKLNPYTILVTTTIGGHLGWFDYKGDRWYSDSISNFLKEIDENWILSEVNNDNLPLDIEKIWKYDRII